MTVPTLLFLLLACLYVFPVASFSVQSEICSGSGVGTKKSERVYGVPVHRTYLSSDHPDSSAWCFSTTVSLDGDDADAASTGMVNFLATQVWPSARVASFALRDLLSSEDRRDDGGGGGRAVCELGCGPGLPSLTAARHGARSVLATDLDPFALRLVEAAAERQGLTPKISASTFDLTGPSGTLPIADLYVLSDAFESSVAARGAARHTVDALSRGGGTRVWVFAQSDRAQREVYREELRRLLRGKEEEFGPLVWSPVVPPGAGSDGGRRLWLCDVDETKVRY